MGVGWPEKVAALKDDDEMYAFILRAIVLYDCVALHTGGVMGIRVVEANGATVLSCRLALTRLGSFYFVSVTESLYWGLTTETF